MSESRRCPQCGAELPSDGPVAPCPACLIKLGLESWADRADGQPGQDAAATEAIPGRFQPPDPEELAEHFPQLEILELLGVGGMGAVYKARQPGLDRLVALKILPPEVGRDPAFAERFSREARAMARLSHPNIVAIHDSGQAGEFYYFVMEFVEGVNLRLMSRTAEFGPQEALAIVPQICEALQYAHDEGIVHRDVKPENILLGNRGRVKIADFGLAKLLGKAPAEFTLTGTGQVMGTLHYMAPEQIERPLEVDHRADIYSLGVVFYEMLTGELPIGRFAPPSEKVQVDVRLDEVVLRALENKPERRYQHASQIKTDVESVGCHSEPLAVATEPAQPRICKLPVVGAIWAPFGLIALGLTFMVTTVSTGEPPEVTLWHWIARLTIAPLGVLAPFACTTLGCLGISRIRSSRSRLIGMPLAVAVALLYPLLVLDGVLLFVGFSLAEGSEYWRIYVAVTALITLLLDVFIIRSVWKAVTKSANASAPV